jgi:hypothetical protein
METSCLASTKYFAIDRLARLTYRYLNKKILKFIVCIYVEHFLSEFEIQN